MDRNLPIWTPTAHKILSLSARRAWIEIGVLRPSRVGKNVALRKESVDRNYCHVAKYRRILPSLSARRAWIEIIFLRPPVLILRVALRKESVDRNAAGSWLRVMNPLSLSARRAWIEILESKQIDPSVMQSLSARRAWIEITHQ